MHKDTERKMALWLSMHPDSTHPLDAERLYDFVREACIHDDEITEDVLHTMLCVAQPSWHETYINQFVDDKIMLIEYLMDFYKFCADDKSVNADERNGRIMTTTIADFMNACGSLNHHELYDMIQAIEGHSEALNFFSVEDEGDIRTITYTISDVSLSFPIPEVSDLIKWLEIHYMDGMDANSWYGFKCALDD